MDAAAHDRAVAAISHLPLVLAAALVEAVSGPAGAPRDGLAAGGGAGRGRLARHDPPRPRRRRDGRRDRWPRTRRRSPPGCATCARSSTTWLAELERPGGPDEAALRGPARGRPGRASTGRRVSIERVLRRAAGGRARRRRLVRADDRRPRRVRGRSGAGGLASEPRAEMEVDPSCKQVIPYLVLRDGAALLPDAADAGRRATRGCTTATSIGVGGHLNPGDGGLLGGLAPRVGARSSSPTSCRTFRLVGLLNDDTTEVGAVHLGRGLRRAMPPVGRSRSARPTSSSGAFATEADGRGGRRPARDLEPARLRGPGRWRSARPPGAAPYNRDAGAASAGGPVRSGELRGGLMAAKILVVDDDPNVQRLLQYTLKQEGYDVVVASDGAEGFRLWGAEAPDLILLDVHAAQARRLPGRDQDPDGGGQRRPTSRSSCSPPSARSSRRSAACGPAPTTT